MKQTNHLPSRRTIAHIATILVILLLTACQTSAKPSATTKAPLTTTASTQTPAPQPTTAAAAAVPPPTPAALVNFGSADQIEPNSPVGWTVESLDGTMFAAAFEDVGGYDRAGNIKRVQSASGLETVVLRAVANENRPDGTKPAQLLVTVIPRLGLKLDEYVTQVTAALTENGGVFVERAGIVYDIGNDGLPVGVVQYTIHAGEGNTNIGGYQLAQFDAEAANLIVLTFTTAASQLTEQIPEFNDIAASVGSGNEVGQ